MFGEVVFWGTLTVIWWMLSATVLLPFLCLLMYSQFFRNRWFSYVFIKCLDLYWAPRLLPLRKKPFVLLEEKLSRRDVTKPLKVLEIGIGSGANLQFYPENSHLTALDMNASFGPYFRKNQKKFPNVVYERTITAMAEDMREIESSTMDVAISSYVLCSVKNVKDVLREIKRVLKPGGKYIFMEHVNHPRSDWGFTVQKFAQPLWREYFDGCHIKRNLDENIKNAGFSEVICDKQYPRFIPFICRPHIFGLATK